MASIVQQVTVYIRSISILTILNRLAQNNINVSGISLLGEVLKMTTSNTQGTVSVLRSLRLVPTVQRVYKVPVQSVPGALYQALLPYANREIVATYIDEDLDQIVEIK